MFVLLQSVGWWKPGSTFSMPSWCCNLFCFQCHNDVAICFWCHHDVATRFVSDAIMMLQHVLFLMPSWCCNIVLFPMPSWCCNTFCFCRAARDWHWHQSEGLMRDRFLWCEMHNKQHDPCLPMQYVGCTNRVKSSREIMFCDVKCTTNNTIPVCPCSTLAALIEWRPSPTLGTLPTSTYPATCTDKQDWVSKY